jgi:hypothetical protein
MVNIYDSVVYVTRLPVRKMAIGINKGNISISALPTTYPHGKRETSEAINTLTQPCIVDTLRGKYPSLQETLEKLQEAKPATYAFDRQFAIDSDGTVFYKTNIVGTIPLSAKSVSEIVFAPSYKHLSILLENNHEKTVGTSCPE